MVKGPDGKFKLAQDHGLKKTNPPTPPRLLAIDPGDVHVGLAQFTQLGEVWGCFWAGEKTPEQFLDWFVDGIKLRTWDTIVVESWRLFPHAAKFYVGSDMPTPKLIGAIEATIKYVNSGEWLCDPPPLIMQSPQIKTPTRGVLKRRKLKSVAKTLGVRGDHASDAELHGYKFLLDSQLPLENNLQQFKRLNQQHPDLTERQKLW